MRDTQSNWNDFTHVFRESVGLIGLWMTLRYVLIWLLSYKPYNDSAFDRTHGTDTGGMVPTRELDLEDETDRWQSNLYLGSPPRVTRHIIESLGIDYADYTFVDYGSGKGRALFVAALYPFKEVIGVEISPPLHRAAVSNLNRYRGKPLQTGITCWCGNALNFELPPGNLVLHMYHPFGPEVLGQVLNHIKSTAGNQPRTILVPYLFSIGVAKAVFREHPQFRRIRDELCVNNLYRWTLYSYTPGDAPPPAP